ncbi:MAG: DeoR/GlpR transcriptional regulator [Lentisphaerae bacterium]|nr:DeoR/GlpR transcriptional regulator [Lentisphaerota bacterium]
MKRNIRQDRILEILARDGESTVESLVNQLGVSVMTIRRDLASLSRSGQLSRTHGGAVLSRTGIVQFEFKDKSQLCIHQKRAIAAEAARMVLPGMSVSLDTGTTTLEVARVLASVDNLTVLTTSLAIASVLQGCDNIELILLGGSVRKFSPDLTGPLTEDNLKNFRTHISILGADAVTRDGSFTTDVRISQISKAMIENSDKAVLVVDSSKFARTAFVQCASLNEIDTIITDDECSPEVREWVGQAECEVIYAKVTNE